MGIVVSTSGEKKAPPYMERLQKKHCSCPNYKLPLSKFLNTFVQIFLSIHLSKLLNIFVALILEFSDLNSACLGSTNEGEIEV